GPFGPEWGSGCRFNFAQFQDQFWAFERIGASLSGHYEISGDLSLFGDLIHSDSTAEARQAPPAIPAPVGGFTLAGGPYVPPWHPANPFNDDLEVYSRMLDGGPRVHTNESEAWRAVAGLEGAWGDWDWRLSALFSENEVTKTYRNLPSQSRYQDALLGMGGPGGNQFFNPFGYEPQNAPDLVDWILADAGLRDSSEERSVDLWLSRLFGALPGGPVGVAAGLQYREQALDQWAEESLLYGDLGHFHDPVSADRDILSAYVEFRLPLLNSLEAQLALRYEDYSDFGSTTNPKIALRWQPHETLLLRGSWGTSFKPPSFSELYRPVQEDFGWYIDVERCELTGLSVDCDYWLYPLEYGGNPDLGPEEGESWFAGTVWTPEFAPGFEFQLDFWEFRHEDRIEWLDPQLVLDEEGSFGIVRAPAEADGTPGRIVLVQETLVNADVLKTSGFDTTLRYRLPTESAGIFRASIMHTYIDTWRFTESLNDALIDREYAGRYRRVPVPRNRANLNLSWDRDAHGAAANFHYTGSYENHTDLYVNGERTDQPMIIGSHTTLDLQYRYTFEGLRQAVLRIGCNNVTDEDPPINYGGLEPFHDGRGRFFYVRWQQPIR
ncbi:MAG: TonB-dependent receptor, partial [Gammaproteobacteria bacterium]|nr:TonB-dependent receptor [Gammaproteobacteria bacterium]